MMKKVYEVKTKADSVLGRNIYNVFAENITEATKKVEKVLKEEAGNEFVFSVSLLVKVEEDEDLEEYIKEIKQNKEE